MTNRFVASNQPIVLKVNDRGRLEKVNCEVVYIPDERQVRVLVNHPDMHGDGGDAASHAAIIGAVLPRVGHLLDQNFGHITWGNWAASGTIITHGQTARGEFSHKFTNTNEAEDFVEQVSDALIKFSKQPVDYIGNHAETMKHEEAKKNQVFARVVEDAMIKILVDDKGINETPGSLMRDAFKVSSELKKPGSDLQQVLEATLGKSDDTAAIVAKTRELAKDIARGHA